MAKRKSLRALREAKSLTQQQLGKKIADYLHREIGDSYAQKKIARFEAGVAAPPDKELQAMAHVLDVKVGVLEELFTAAYDAGSIIDQIADSAPSGRTL